MSNLDEKNSEHLKVLAGDIGSLLKKGCDIESIKGVNIYSSYLEGETSVSVVEIYGTFNVIACQDDEVVFDMTYRKGSWAKVNVYRPSGTWETIIRNRAANKSDSNVLYTSAWIH